MARLFAAGVDSMYLSARGEVEETFGPLREARAKAEAIGEPVAWGEVGCFALQVMPFEFNSGPRHRSKRAITWMTGPALAVLAGRVTMR